LATNLLLISELILRKMLEASFSACTSYQKLSIRNGSHAGTVPQIQYNKVLNSQMCDVKQPTKNVFFI